MIKEGNTLIITSEDTPPENPHYFKGSRYLFVFIHKDNKYKEEFRNLTICNRTVLGVEIGKFCEYED